MSMIGHCSICTEETEGRHINIYIVGSEGINICHDCDMLLVSHIREMKQLVAKAKMLGVKIGKGTRNVF